MAQVASTEARPRQRAAATSAAARRDAGVLRPAVQWGLIGGAAAVFVSAIGMVEGFAARTILDPFLTLGYLVFVLVPFTFGWVAGRDVVGPGGQRMPVAPSHRLLSGLVAGVLTGATVVAFVALFSAVELQRIFVNVSPVLLDRTLLFGRGLAVGSLLLVGGGAVIALAGAAVHLIPAAWRRPVLTGLLWVLTIGILQDLVRQFFRGVGLPALAGVFYTPAGGLTPVGAVIVFAIVVAADKLLGGRRRQLAARYRALPQAQRRIGAIVAIAVAAVLLAFVPIVFGTFISEVLDLVGIYLLMALGLNIVVGYAGMLDLGYVAFFAVGAYATAVLTSPDSPALTPELVFWAALPFIVLAAALSGVLVGTPVLRMRGDYLAIVTLGFGEIARLLFQSDWLSPVFGGAQGITQVPGIQVGATVLNTPTQFYYPIVLMVLLTAYIAWALYNSRLGRAWTAIREDEPVAEALGINIVSAKLSAFVIGAVLASFGGALFASKIGAIFPNSFSIIVSIVILVIIIVGGMGSLVGVAVGALVIQGVPQLLREFEEFQFLLYGALLIFMMLVKPEGLAPSKQRAQELHQEEMLQDAWLSREQDQEERETPARALDRDPDTELR